MAMNGNSMAGDVVTAIEAEMVSQGLPAWSAPQRADAVSFWEAICGAIVGHIVANAVVATTGTADTTGLAVVANVVQAPVGGEIAGAITASTGGVT